MARETVTTTRYSCERCRKSASIDAGCLAAGDWSSLQFQTNNGGTIAGRYKLEDLCPECTDSLEAWIKNA